MMSHARFYENDIVAIDCGNYRYCFSVSQFLHYHTTQPQVHHTWSCPHIDNGLYVILSSITWPTDFDLIYVKFLCLGQVLYFHATFFTYMQVHHIWSTLVLDTLMMKGTVSWYIDHVVKYFLKKIFYTNDLQVAGKTYMQIYLSKLVHDIYTI